MRLTQLRSAVVLGGLVLAGCQSLSAISTSYVPLSAAAKYEARPKDYPIEFFSAAPSRAYVELGPVSAAGCSTCRSEWVAEKLRLNVREIGGDAVIHLTAFTAPFGTESAGALTIQGVAIRWQQ